MNNDEKAAAYDEMARAERESIEAKLEHGACSRAYIAGRCADERLLEQVFAAYRRRNAAAIEIDRLMYRCRMSIIE